LCSTYPSPSPYLTAPPPRGEDVEGEGDWGGLTIPTLSGAPAKGTAHGSTPASGVSASTPSRRTAMAPRTAASAAQAEVLFGAPGAPPASPLPGSRGYHGHVRTPGAGGSGTVTTPGPVPGHVTVAPLPDIGPGGVVLPSGSPSHGAFLQRRAWGVARLFQFDCHGVGTLLSISLSHPRL
jgi:hypothetical protein